MAPPTEPPAPAPTTATATGRVTVGMPD
jgi:hypothetical protein